MRRGERVLASGHCITYGYFLCVLCSERGARDADGDLREGARCGANRGESHRTGARNVCEARERRARCRERRVGPAVSARRAAETRQLFSRCESLNAKWRREDVRSLACCPLKLTSYTRSFRSASEQYDPHAAVRFPFSSFIVCEKGGDFKMQAADVRASQQHRMPHEHTRTPHAKVVLTVCGH